MGTCQLSDRARKRVHNWQLPDSGMITTAAFAFTIIVMAVGAGAMRAWRWWSFRDERDRNKADSEFKERLCRQHKELEQRLEVFEARQENDSRALQEALMEINKEISEINGVLKEHLRSTSNE